MTLPDPKLTPPLDAVPGKTARLLAPMLAMVFWIALDEPLPISIMAMTAATPMIMPSVVRAARRTLRRRPFSAVRNIRPKWKPAFFTTSVPCPGPDDFKLSAAAELSSPPAFESIRPSRMRMIRLAESATVGS